MSTTHDQLYAAGHKLLRATHGRDATYYTIAGAATSTIQVLCRFGEDETEAEIEVAYADVTSPVAGDYILLADAAASVYWYVAEVLYPPSMAAAGGASILRCTTNRARQ